MQGSADIDPLGNPWGFFNSPQAQHAPSYPLLVTTQMSRDRSVKQLILMSDGHYLSDATDTMLLRLVSYNADAQSLAYIQYPFLWQQAGVIVAGPPQILGLPVLPYSSYARNRSGSLCCKIPVQMPACLHARTGRHCKVRSVCQPACLLVACAIER